MTSTDDLDEAIITNVPSGYRLFVNGELVKLPCHVTKNDEIAVGIPPKPLKTARMWRGRLDD